MILSRHFEWSQAAQLYTALKSATSWNDRKELFGMTGSELAHVHALASSSRQRVSELKERHGLTDHDIIAEGLSSGHESLFKRYCYDRRYGEHGHVKIEPWVKATWYRYLPLDRNRMSDLLQRRIDWTRKQILALEVNPSGRPPMMDRQRLGRLEDREARLRSNLRVLLAGGDLYLWNVTIRAPASWGKAHLVPVLKGDTVADVMLELESEGVISDDSADTYLGSKRLGEATALEERTSSTVLYLIKRFPTIDNDNDLNHDHDIITDKNTDFDYRVSEDFWGVRDKDPGFYLYLPYGYFNDSHLRPRALLLKLTPGQGSQPEPSLNGESIGRPPGRLEAYVYPRELVYRVVKENMSSTALNEVEKVHITSWKLVSQQFATDDVEMELPFTKNKFVLEITEINRQSIRLPRIMIQDTLSHEIPSRSLRLAWTYYNITKVVFPRSIFFDPMIDMAQTGDLQYVDHRERTSLKQESSSETLIDPTSPADPSEAKLKEAIPALSADIEQRLEELSGAKIGAELNDKRPATQSPGASPGFSSPPLQAVARRAIDGRKDACISASPGEVGFCTIRVPYMGCLGGLADVNDIVLNFTLGSEPGSLNLGGRAIYPPNADGVPRRGSFAPLRSEMPAPKACVVPAELATPEWLQNMTQCDEVPITGWTVGYGTNSELTIDVSSIAHGHVLVCTVRIFITAQRDKPLVINDVQLRLPKPDPWLQPCAVESSPECYAVRRMNPPRLTGNGPSEIGSGITRYRTTPGRPGFELVKKQSNPAINEEDLELQQAPPGNVAGFFLEL